VKIILSAYNFYPVHKGGTEVYTKALAVYLQGINLEVLVIAALDESNTIHGKLITDNDEIKAVYYLYENISVLGVQLKKQTTDDIYAGANKVWTENFVQILEQMGWQDATQLIMNGITTVSGLSLCDAMERLNANIKISIVVHTPFICPKADMIFSANKKRCEQILSKRVCASCIITEKTGIPFSISRFFNAIVNQAPLQKLLSSTAFRLEELLEKKFSSFSLLNKRTIAWIVFSNDMQQFLARQLFITPEKITVIRHGIDTNIFFDSGIKREIAPIRFLYAGRFEEVKGVNLLSEAWHSMQDRPDKQHLFLVGNWKETKTGKKVASLLEKRNDVKFMDALGQTALAALYRKTHCVIIPSKWIETGPLVFHEAIACGCDIITSDTGGQGELASQYKNKSTVFSSGNKNSLYQAIVGYKPSEKENDCFPITEAEHFERLCHRLAISSN
jgi:glycosyltransferase involved in cell wall biosynthesis